MSGFRTSSALGFLAKADISRATNTQTTQELTKQETCDMNCPSFGDLRHIRLGLG